MDDLGLTKHVSLFVRRLFPVVTWMRGWGPVGLLGLEQSDLLWLIFQFAYGLRLYTAAPIQKCAGAIPLHQRISGRASLQRAIALAEAADVVQYLNYSFSNQSGRIPVFRQTHTERYTCIYKYIYIYISIFTLALRLAVKLGLPKDPMKSISGTDQKAPLFGERKDTRWFLIHSHFRIGHVYLI